jgi:hypothetical protein
MILLSPDKPTNANEEVSEESAEKEEEKEAMTFKEF